MSPSKRDPYHEIRRRLDSGAEIDPAAAILAAGGHVLRRACEDLAERVSDEGSPPQSEPAPRPRPI